MVPVNTPDPRGFQPTLQMFRRADRSAWYGAGHSPGAPPCGAGGDIRGHGDVVIPAESKTGSLCSGQLFAKKRYDRQESREAASAAP